MELDRQPNEQFSDGLNDTDMLGKIIWELTKLHENEKITSENGQREMRFKEPNLPS